MPGKDTGISLPTSVSMAETQYMFPKAKDALGQLRNKDEPAGLQSQSTNSPENIETIDHGQVQLNC